MKRVLVEELVGDVRNQRIGYKQAGEVWEVYKKVNRFQTQEEAQVWIVSR